MVSGFFLGYCCEFPLLSFQDFRLLFDLLGMSAFGAMVPLRIAWLTIWVAMRLVLSKVVGRDAMTVPWMSGAKPPMYRSIFLYSGLTIPGQSDASSLNRMV